MLYPAELWAQSNWNLQAGRLQAGWPGFLRSVAYGDPQGLLSAHPYHVAVAYMVSGWRDSNSRSPAPKAGALATRLHPGGSLSIRSGKRGGQSGSMGRCECCIPAFSLADRRKCAVPSRQAMARDHRASEITLRLNEEYPDRRPLLVYSSPFELVVGVILSAQTTDAQVNQVTPELFRRYPDAEALSRADHLEIERIVHSTGFFRNKAKNVIAAAARIQDGFAGEVPEAMEDLITIPGMGRKSANVIRGVIYGEPAIVVDTHLTRVTNRIGLVKGKNPEKLERELCAIVPEALQTDFSMGVNLHGRAVCTARGPACDRCVIRDLCDYGQSAAVSEQK